MKDDYNIEVQKKWGETSLYQDYQRKTQNYTVLKWENINNELNNMIKTFSEYNKAKISFDDQVVLDLVARFKNHIDSNYYSCSNDMLLSLGKLYIEDERFQNNIDKYYEKTAVYIYQAICNYVKNNQN